MRTIYLDTKDPFILGKTGESNRTALRVKVEQWYQEYPDGHGAILFMRPNRVIFPLETNLIEYNGEHYLEAIVTSNETKMAGFTVVTAQWYDGETLAHGLTFSGKVLTSAGSNPTDGVTETTPTWVSRLIAELATINETAATVQEAYEKMEEAVSKIDEALDTAEETVAQAQDAAEAAQTAKTNAATSAAAAAVSATQAMSTTPEGYNAIVASLARVFDPATAYSAGEYVNQNSTIYRFTSDHAAGDWTGTDAVAVKMADDLGDLKSAINDLNGTYRKKPIYPYKISIGYTANTSGRKLANPARALFEMQKIEDLLAIGVSGEVYQIIVALYETDSQDSFIGMLNPDFSSELQIIHQDTNAQYFRIAVRRNDQANISADEATAIYNAIYGYSPMSIPMLMVNDYCYISIGSFNTDEGTETNTQLKMAKTDYIDSRTFGSIRVSAGYQIGFAAFDGNKNKVGSSSGWHGGTQTTLIDIGKIASIINASVSDIKYVRFLFRNTSNTNVDLSDLKEKTVYKSVYSKICGSVLDGKKISIYGDSISTFAGWIPEGNATFYTGSNCGVDDVNDTWWKKVINALGLELLVNNSWSGRAVSNARDSETGHETDAGYKEANILQLKSGDVLPEVIIIKLGINDFNHGGTLGTYDGRTAIPADPSTFTNAYAIMLDLIMTNYPLAKVYCCTLMQSEISGAPGFPEINANGESLTAWNEAIRKLAHAFGAKVLDHDTCGITYYNLSTYMGDWSSTSKHGLHPNADGHSLIANATIHQMDNSIRFRY